MFAPARFPALALPEDVGGMLLDDGGVEVADAQLERLAQCRVARIAVHDFVRHSECLNQPLAHAIGDRSDAHSLRQIPVGARELERYAVP